ncbi:MAG: LysE family transporter [Bacteroidales bacterium]|nr:LysE family transporter [Bacteroidales bacterium]MBN2820046.1 LysE family transporter [Bacteroidales bacterium]
MIYDILIQLLFRGLIAGLIYALPVGPLAILSIQRVVESGRRAGMISFLGMAAADLVYIFLAAFSFSMVHSYIEENFWFLKYISFLVLLLLGISIIVFDFPEKTNSPKSGLFKNSNYFLSTFLLGLSNPVALIVFINAWPILYPKTILHTNADLILLVGSILFGMLLWWTLIVFISNYLGSFINQKFLLYSRKVFGGVIIIIASASIFLSLLNISYL